MAEQGVGRRIKKNTSKSHKGWEVVESHDHPTHPEGIWHIKENLSYFNSSNFKY